MLLRRPSGQGFRGAGLILRRPAAPEVIAVAGESLKDGYEGCLHTNPITVVDLAAGCGDASHMKPKVGEMAPDFTATVVDGETVSVISLADLRGERVVLVFYPRDNTPGCTIQACSLREHWDDIKGKARVFGVSADSVASHKKFISKRELPYPLIADEDKAICEAYGVWVQKSMMGKKFMGIERSTFVIGVDGKLEAILEKVSPLSHTEKLTEILG